MAKKGKIILKKKTCKICKTKFEPFRPLQIVCSSACGFEYANKQKQKDWNKRKKKLKEELITVQDLLKLAQIAFNAYIRERDKGKPCISCGNENPKKINAGHYYSSGGHKNVTFNEDNVHLQCEHCNTYLSGNLIEYGKGILKRIGNERLTNLDNEAHKERKFTRDELKALTMEYKAKLKELKKN